MFFYFLDAVFAIRSTFAVTPFLPRFLHSLLKLFLFFVGVGFLVFQNQTDDYFLTPFPDADLVSSRLRTVKSSAVRIPCHLRSRGRGGRDIVLLTLANLCSYPQLFASFPYECVTDHIKKNSKFQKEVSVCKFATKC